MKTRKKRPQVSTINLQSEDQKSKRTRQSLLNQRILLPHLRRTHILQRRRQILHDPHTLRLARIGIACPPYDRVEQCEIGLGLL